MLKKYKTRNQFRYSKNKKAGYHPHYIFGEKDGKYLSFGMTTHPGAKFKVSELTKSPNPQNRKKQYIQHKVFKMKKGAYDKKRLKGWGFDIRDLPLIRHMKKKYKKGK